MKKEMICSLGKKELANLEGSDDLNQGCNLSLCGHRTEHSGKKK
jgi:hypothetical protein